jgi:carbohydrate-selective porin OprB
MSLQYRERLRGRLVKGLQWFPQNQPELPSYLSSQDELGNTALQPEPFLHYDEITRRVQRVKYTLSDFGLYYTFQQALGYAASLNHALEDDRSLGYYAFELYAKQLVFSVPSSRTAGWISLEVNGGDLLNTSIQRLNRVARLGPLADPVGTVSPVEGLYLGELAWQQSFAGGKAVFLAGVLDQTNYLDANTYANDQFAQFYNSAFVNSMVLPLMTGGLGVNLQWQPNDDYYLMCGAGPNNPVAGRSPLRHLGVNNMSYLFEAGYLPDNLLGLGPGAYRLQPFVATVGGVTQTGIGLNINQQLGAHWGFFARLGTGGATVTNIQGASAQLATGLVLQNPLRLAGLLTESRNNFLGFGFVWSQPAQAQRPAAHLNEYGLELGYRFQLTATTVLKTDLQAIWNPVNNPQIDSILIFQLALITTW